MADGTQLPDVDDAHQYIVQFLRAGRHQRRSGGYGYGVYLPFVMMAYLEDHGSTDSHNQSLWSRLSPSFYAAAWELCRRGVLRPGITHASAQATADGASGNGYSITPYGEEWLKDATANDLLPSEPGRFAKMLATAGARFGAGFVERSQEAVRAHRALAFLACCVMCGAASESIMLALAIAKKSGDENHVLGLYLSGGGTKKVENLLLGGQSALVRDEFHRYTALLKYWRDSSAHGRAVQISEPEAYQSLALLLRFTLWADSRWEELTA
jgi:hypothetical protein